ncbi:hypothetical protein PMAYCL1PPCAC_25693, partial [Pristionchus mayeri]
TMANLNDKKNRCSKVNDDPMVFNEDPVEDFDEIKQAEPLVLFENETSIKEEPMDVKEDLNAVERPNFGNFTKESLGIAED